MISNLRFPIYDFKSSFVNRQSKILLRGLTLVELLVSIAITSVLILTIGSVMLIATHAMPNANGPANQIIVASEVTEQLARELQYAVSINNHSATMVDFTVADRNGDEVPEVIRYEWSGTAGAPLTRQYNGGTAMDFLDSVQEFNLLYDLETISNETITGNESAETQLLKYYSYTGISDFSIKDNQWFGHYFLPSLPADAISWKVTHVAFYAKASGSQDGQIRVQLQLPTTGKVPSGTVLEEKTLMESSLMYTYSKQEFDFSEVCGLSPTQGLCLVFKWISGSTACLIKYNYLGGGTTNSFAVKSSNQGATWTALTNQSLCFSVYGTVTTAGTPQIQQTFYLGEIQIKLRTGSDEQSTIYASTNPLNRPEVIQ